MSGAMFIVIMDPGLDPGNDPFAEQAALVAEFEGLILSLDDHSIKREGWERFVGILAQATLEAGDAEAGQAGYDRALAQWRMSRHFDGRD